MKLATLMDGSRDGQLAVVSRDLTLAHFATGIATTLRQLLDDWNFVSPQLEDLSALLNGGKARHAFPFEPARCLPPLPRPVAWWQIAADGALEPQAGPCRWGAERRLDGAALTASDWTLTPALAAVTGDLAAEADADAALEALRLLMLAGDWRAAGANGAAQTAFGPVLVTPDELGAAWVRGRLQGSLRLEAPGQPLRRIELATAVPGEGWGARLAAAAAGRPLAAGSLLVAPLALALDGAGAAGGGRRATRWRLGFVGADGDEPLGTIGGHDTPPEPAEPEPAAAPPADPAPADET